MAMLTFFFCRGAGVWGGLFSTFDCAVKGVRKKEDPYNAISASTPLSLLFNEAGYIGAVR